MHRGVKSWDRGDERVDAAGDADRDGKDVVDEQGGGGDESRPLAQIVMGDDIGAAAVRIGMYGLPVGGADDDHEQGNAGGDCQINLEGVESGENQTPSEASVAYATEEMASEESTASAFTLVRR